MTSRLVCGDGLIVNHWPKVLCRRAAAVELGVPSLVTASARGNYYISTLSLSFSHPFTLYQHFMVMYSSSGPCSGLSLCSVNAVMQALVLNSSH